MKSKLLKTLVYIFFVCIIVFFVLSINTSTLTWVHIAKYVCLILAALILIFYIYLFVFFAIDNKKIEQFSFNDDYENLVIYINKKLKQKLYFVPERKHFYNYYLLLSYLHLKDEEMIETYFNKEIDLDVFPIVSYWKASYELSKNNKENILTYYEEFKISSLINKNINRYQNIFNTFECMVLYVKEDYETLKEKIKIVDESKITIPSTIKVLDMINKCVADK